MVATKPPCELIVDGSPTGLMTPQRALPLAAGSVDLVFSCQMLPWIDDLRAVLGEVRRVLSERGYFTFATVGPDTLKELRAAWAEADRAAHVHPFAEHAALSFKRPASETLVWGAIAVKLKSTSINLLVRSGWRPSPRPDL